MPDVAETLEAAADLIEPEGCWIQEYYSELGGEYDEICGANCFCVAGAIARVLGRDGLGGLDWAQAHFAPIMKVRDVPEWNDAPERTQAEVVAALRDAAEQWRAEHA